MSSFTGDNLQNDGGTTSFVEELVGEGKKFKDVEELAKGKLEADRYIEQIKAEKNAETEALNSKLEELISRLSETNKNTSPNSEGSNNEGNTNPDTQANTTPQIDAASVETLVQEALQKTQTNNKRSENLLKVEADLDRHFGERKAEVVSNKARELGVTPQKLQELAEESPAAFFSLMGVDATKSGTTFTSTVNSEAVGASVGNAPGETERWSYYRKMKQENPKKFYSSMAEIESLIDKYGRDTFYNS